MVMHKCDEDEVMMEMLEGTLEIALHANRETKAYNLKLLFGHMYIMQVLFLPTILACFCDCAYSTSYYLTCPCPIIFSFDLFDFKPFSFVYDKF